jgi:hypothetical protein
LALNIGVESFDADPNRPAARPDSHRRELTSGHNVADGLLAHLKVFGNFSDRT